MWLIIVIVCLIAGFVSEPLDRVIRKKVSSKWLSIVLQLVVNFIILMALYGIAALLGFDIWK